MSDDLSLVLPHGSTTGSLLAAVRNGLEAHGAMMLVLDLTGYGRSPAPSEAWQLEEARP